VKLKFKNGNIINVIESNAFIRGKRSEVITMKSCNTCRCIECVYCGKILVACDEYIPEDYFTIEEGDEKIE
jgi:hypothetical protein